MLVTMITLRIQRAICRRSGREEERFIVCTVYLVVKDVSWNAHGQAPACYAHGGYRQLAKPWWARGEEGLISSASSNQ
jgi:hypothetical protein